MVHEDEGDGAIPLTVDKPTAALALEAVFLAVREHGREHAVRYGTWSDIVVLVGAGLWEQLVLELRTMQMVMSGRRLPDGLLLIAAPGGREAKVIEARHLDPLEWRALSDLGVTGTLAPGEAT